MEVIQEVEMRPLWEREFAGKTWRDMPGACNENKKLNFCLFRRGELKLDEAQVEVEMSDGGTEVVTVMEGAAGRSSMVRRGLVGRAREQVMRGRKMKVRWGTSKSLSGAAAASAARKAEQGEKPVLPEVQVRLLARYRELTGALNRMDKPRSMLLASVQAEGWKEGALLGGLERGLRWKPALCEAVARGLDKLEAHLMASRAMRDEVEVLMGQYWTRFVGPTRMVDLCRESEVSDQTIRDFRAGKLVMLASMTRMKAALEKLLARQF